MVHKASFSVAKWDRKTKWLTQTTYLLWNIKGQKWQSSSSPPVGLFSPAFHRTGKLEKHKIQATFSCVWKGKRGSPLNLMLMNSEMRVGDTPVA